MNFAAYAHVTQKHPAHDAIFLSFPFLTLYRESKLVDKASQHMQNTAQRFDDENALMSSCFFNLEDDIFEYERHAARLHLIRNAAAFDAIAYLNKVSEVETRVRAAEDVEVLDTVIETQGLLQQTVSSHYPALHQLQLELVEV